ncbi:MAG TPA: hypothetical protein VG497_07545 [Kribbella sp.]|nr:hypothetical protein [Kribbella sp.]
MAERGRDFADKLNHLFAVTKSPDGDEYSNDFAADSITVAGTKISGTYIWQLRKRKRDNPTIKHVEGLAKFFGVPVNYFFDDDVTDRVDRQLRKRKRDNPTIKHVEGLARFFGVPVNYFFDDDVTDRVDQQLRDLAAEQERLKANAGDQEAQRIAMRAGELTPDRRQLVMDLLDVVYRDQQAARERGER